MRLDYYGFLSHGARHALLMVRSDASMADEDHVSSAVSAVEDDAGYDDDWGLKSVVELDAVKRLGAKFHLREFL